MIELTAGSVYQEFLARSLTDKYATLSTQLDGVIDEANGQINQLQEKLAGMSEGDPCPLPDTYFV